METAAAALPELLSNPHTCAGRIPPPRGWAQAVGRGWEGGCVPVGLGRGLLGQILGLTRQGRKVLGAPSLEPGGAAAGWGAPSVPWGSQVKDVEAKKWSSGSQAPGALCARVGCACVYLRVEGTGAPRSLRYC